MIVAMVIGALVAGLGVQSASLIGALSKQPVEMRIGTGGEGGTYFPLGRGLAAVFNRVLPDRIRAEAITTAGSTDNLERLYAGDVNAAIVQNDASVRPVVRAIAPLYPEVLQIVVRHEIENLTDFIGRKAAAGPENSGTDKLVGRVLDHFGMSGYAETLIHCDTTEAIQRFMQGELDAVFIVSGLKSPAVEQLLATGKATLLSLGDPSIVGSALDGLRISHPFLTRSVIPARTYGVHPKSAVGTVAVQAVLVTRVDMDDGLIQAITETLFDNRVALMEAHRVATHLTEQFDPAALQAPLHKGAARYYRRDAPPFFVQYAELMSLVLSLVLVIGSALIALSRWVQRRKKDRIDVYYLEIRDVMKRWETGQATSRGAASELIALRTRAFEDLVSERLSADASFTIFQDYVTSELHKLERYQGAPG